MLKWLKCYVSQSFGVLLRATVFSLIYVGIYVGFYVCVRLGCYNCNFVHHGEELQSMAESGLSPVAGDIVVDVVLVGAPPGFVREVPPKQHPKDSRRKRPICSR
eukprot:6211105-Amphidinium_carterae.1